MPPLLSVRGLHVHFHTPRGVVRALRGIDLDVAAGEAVGLVGESGSGKTVLSLAVLGLLPRPPASVSARSVEFEGRDLRRLSPRELRRLRGNRIAMVFQDPLTSLNPYLAIGDQVAEPLLIHRGLGARAARGRAEELLARVGIPDPGRHLRSYPHELSGGMRQRAMIAMAIACEPALLIADEPTTALDVTIQAQILDLLSGLMRSSGTAVVLITHSLAVVAGFCDRVDVLYAGRIAERGPTEPLFAAPAHPYTRALLRVASRAAAPAEGKRLFAIPGLPPDLIESAPGCSFAPRCGLAFERCREEGPGLAAVPGEEGRERACFRPLPLEEEGR